MFKRMFGILTFKPETYRTVAASKDALEQAGVLVIVVALMQSLFGVLKGTVEIGTSGGINSTILSLTLNIILSLVIWLIISWLLTVVAAVFGGRMGLVEALRVAGFVQVFGLVSVFTLFALANPRLAFLEWVTALVIAFLSLYGFYLAVREISGLPAGKAFLTALLASVGWWFVIFLIDRLASAVLPGSLWYIHFMG